MSYLDDACTAITAHEGSIPFLYLDTRGNVTVGVGLLVPNLTTALALPLHVNGMGGTQPATGQQITDDWNRVIGMRMGLAANAYESGMSVFLEPDDITAKLMNYIATEDLALYNGLTGYNSYPDPAKVALLDMGYELGTAGLLHGYPHLCAACEAGDWITASQQCHRNGPSAARNQWTVAQFIAASTSK